MLAVCLVLPGSASADRAFSSRFSTNTQGDIAIAANSLESCLDAVAACAAARAAAGNTDSPTFNNNNWTMTWIDADGDPATFDSSSADLTLPAGASVLFAGLYYGGRLTKGSGGSNAPNAAARNTVRFKAPGDESYRSLTASQVDDASTQYQGFVDVTGIVAAAGAGTYWTANVQLGTGVSDSSSGGWALVVAYGDPSPSATMRNLSVFDGMQTVGSAGAVTIPLSGFRTPLSPPVNSTVGMVAYEGDLATTGDGAKLQRADGTFTALANGVNPGSDTVASRNNVFNSTISNAGVLVTSRTPSFANNLGYDADLFTTTNVLGTGQTSTQVLLSTTGDAYQPGVVTIATDLFAPKIVGTKTVTPLAANLGDTLTYTMALGNIGQDGATATTLTDEVPAGTVYVPGSLRVNGAAVSDAGGDDTGELAGGRVVARLGTGASTGAGGTLAPGANATVSFQVTVATSGLARGATIENAADVSFRAATTDVPTTLTSAPASTRVNVPDLAIGKTHSPALSPGSTSTYTITMSNVGDGPTSGPVTVIDTPVPGLTLNGPVTGPGWSCSTAGELRCTRSDPLAAGSDYPPISVPVRVDPGTQPGLLSNTARLQAPSDGSSDNDTFTDAGAVSEPVIDLSIDKAVTSTPAITPVGYATGETVTYRLQVANNGLADAANVQLTEAPDPRLTIQSITPSQGTCAGTVCDLGTITTTQAPVTIDVTAVLPPDLSSGAYPSAALLDNTATASAPVGNEINPDDNTASASIATLAYADISLTKSFSPEHPVAGGPVTYTLNVHNDGPGSVDVFSGDRLPPELLNPTATISGGTGVCRYDPTGESIGAPPGVAIPVIACDIPQFGPGEDRVITIQGTLAADSAGKVVDNLAFAATVVPLTDLLFDPDNFADNVGEAVFTPGTVDVAITKTRVGTGTVPVGGDVVFRLEARNDGDAPGTGVEVHDSLPAGLTPVDAPAACAIAGQDVTCRVDELDPGQQRAFEITARAEPSAAGQTLTNRGTVTAVAADPEPADNTSEATVTIATSIAASSPPAAVVAQCRSGRRFTIRIREHRPRLVRSAEVLLAGRRIAVMRRGSDRRLIATIDLRGRPRGTYVVEIRARLRDGRRVRWVRSYRTCVDGLPPSNRLSDPRAL